MNKTFIIGNLTRDPELRTVNGQDGPVSVCDFTVAVNRKNGRSNANGQQEADFFKVTVWRGLADVCAQYLAKGRKVSVVGPVSASAYIGNDGNARATWRSKPMMWNSLRRSRMVSMPRKAALRQIITRPTNTRTRRHSRNTSSSA